MRRLFAGLGIGALAVAGIAAIWWSNSTPPDQVLPPASAPQASAPPPSPAPTAPQTPTAPSFDIVKVDPGGHAVIAGRAAPGARVRVLDGSASLGEVTADGRGEWVLVPTAPIAPGERQLTLEATDAQGVTAKSKDTVALAVAPPAQRGGGTVAVLLPGDASQPAQAMQIPGARSGPLSLDTAEIDGQGRLMVSGHAAPGATVNLYAANEAIGRVIADASGKWSAVSARPPAAGKVELRVDQLKADGTVAQRVAAPFEPQPPEPVEGGTYTVQAGNSLWLIARKAYGGGTRYTTIFTANKTVIRDPNLIYPGQVISLPKS